MKKIACFILLLSTALLSACYTNFNQRIPEKYREYKGYDLYYGNENHEAVLPAQLYRKGNTWYIAGVRCGVDALFRIPSMHYWNSTWYDRHEYGPLLHKKSEVYYHKISPEVARRIVASRNYRLDDSAMAEALKKGGGSWQRHLPAGAQPVPAALLKSATMPHHWVQVESSTLKGPWYIYPVTGLIFVCFDVPYSMVCSSVYAAYTVVSAPLRIRRVVSRTPAE